MDDEDHREEDEKAESCEDVHTNLITKVGCHAATVSSCGGDDAANDIYSITWKDVLLEDVDNVVSCDATTS